MFFGFRRAFCVSFVERFHRHQAFTVSVSLWLIFILLGYSFIRIRRRMDRYVVRTPKPKQPTSLPASLPLPLGELDSSDSAANHHNLLRRKRRHSDTQAQAEALVEGEDEMALVSHTRIHPCEDLALASVSEVHRPRDSDDLDNDGNKHERVGMHTTPSLDAEPAAKKQARHADSNFFQQTSKQLGARKVTLVLVRHGESTFNANPTMATKGTPDAPLTLRGKKQAISAGTQLLNLGYSPFNSHWVTSPLTRAMQTLTGALHAFDAPNVENAELLTPNVEVLDLVREQLMTIGDVGRPKSILLEQCKHLVAHKTCAESFEKLDECWWHAASENVVENAGRGDVTIRKREPLETVRLRASRLLKHVRTVHSRRREHDASSSSPFAVVIFGHGTLFNSLIELCGGARMLGAPERRLKNGEVVTVNLPA